MGSQQLRIALLVILAAAVGVVLWLVLGHSSKHKKAHAHIFVGIGPIAYNSKNLAAESRFINTKFFWAGKQQGVRYEFTRSTRGYLYVRYLPKGVPVGVKHADYLIVATYPFPGAYKALKDQAKGKAVAGPNGSIVYPRPKYKKSVLMAFPGVPDQIEIYAPNASVAVATAESGQIRPVTAH